MRPIPRALTAAIAAAIVLTGCSTADAPEATTTQTEAAFPVTVKHAFGTTTIAAEPTRVASVAWSNHEVPIALGIIPVGMSKATWGDDDGDGVLPWVEEALTAAGAQTPVLFDETDGIDFEAVANTKPDLILATYSGLTKEEYTTLSKIAPVVAYPSVAWGTSWQQMLRLSGKALGRAQQAEQFITDQQAKVTAALDANADLKNKRILFSYIDPADLSQVGFYTSHDTRPGFFKDLGFPMPKAVDEASAKTEAFYTTISAEQGDQLADVDVFVTYGDPAGDLVKQLQADPLLSKIPAIAAGRIAILANSTPLAASANPSPLSIGWGINDYFALLAGALKG